MKIPQELFSVQFDKSRAFGYKTEEVDKFISTVRTVVDQLSEENELLAGKLETVARELERYKDDEDSLKAALLGAQKLGDSILKDSRSRAAVVLAEATGKSEMMLTEAEKKAEAIVGEARAKGDVLLDEALAKHDAVLGDLEAKLAREKEELAAAKEETSRFKSSLVEMYKSHLEMVMDIPGQIIELPSAEAPMAGTTGQAKPKQPSKPTKDEPEEKPSPPGARPEQPAQPDEQIGMYELLGIRDDAGQKQPAHKKAKQSESSRFGKLYFGDDYDISQDD